MHAFQYEIKHNISAISSSGTVHLPLKNLFPAYLHSTVQVAMSRVPREPLESK